MFMGAKDYVAPVLLFCYGRFRASHAFLQDVNLSKSYWLLGCWSPNHNYLAIRSNFSLQ
jgi:hypothetical protein